MCVESLTESASPARRQLRKTLEECLERDGHETILVEAHAASATSLRGQATVMEISETAVCIRRTRHASTMLQHAIDRLSRFQQ